MEQKQPAAGYKPGKEDGRRWVGHQHLKATSCTTLQPPTRPQQVQQADINLATTIHTACGTSAATEGVQPKQQAADCKPGEEDG
jgi:hypothetical protein